LFTSAVKAIISPAINSRHHKALSMVKNSKGAVGFNAATEEFETSLFSGFSAIIRHKQAR
jgi:hypothetical protein